MPINVFGESNSNNCANKIDTSLFVKKKPYLRANYIESNIEEDIDLKNQYTSSSTALLTSIATLITNEYVSKLRTRYTKLTDWINVITLLYEKTLK